MIVQEGSFHVHCRRLLVHRGEELQHLLLCDHEGWLCGRHPQELTLKRSLFQGSLIAMAITKLFNKLDAV